MNATTSHAAPLSFSFNRAPLPALIEALLPGGPLAFVTQLVREDKLWDLGFRGSRVDIYRGRCVVLQVEADLDGQLSLMIDSPKFRKAGFDVAWKTPRPAAEYQDAVPAIRDYLTAVSPLVNVNFINSEAAFHGAVTHHRFPSTLDVIVVDRAAAPTSTGTPAEREAALKRPRHSYERLAGASLGKEADALAVSADGSTLFVIEVKSDLKLLEKAVGQICWYAALFRWWVARDPELASQTIQDLAAARLSLGLAPLLPGEVKIQRVVPVIALPRSAGVPSPSSLTEAARRLTGALGHDGAVPEIWELDPRAKAVVAS